MTLTYRGCRYQPQVAPLPMVKSETEVAIAYRGIPSTVKQYEFQTSKLTNPNWRTMRFLGKVYLAAPTQIMAIAQ
ncbi:MAG: DUF4278 domain-containing protein [Thainema sp.]